MHFSSGHRLAAARRMQREQQEEEEMTSYGPWDLAEDWEFKILRSNTGAFRDPACFRAVLEDEKRGGWVLVEKFDDCRLRLKRPARAKAVEEDIASGYDPYRTSLPLPLSESMTVFLIFAGVIGFMFACFLVMLAVFH